ncbi:MAG: molybdate ABC transporter substrate-binding protein [Pseudohongiella sp.]|nr:MAG: molybdate ABC transporter substrate-binding protein [Pseudohongiella sp.]
MLSACTDGPRICLLIAALTCVNLTYGESLNVAVASNFVPAMQRLEPLFEVASGHEITIIRGSSGKHFAQISNGAPFDVFLSADQLRPKRLIEEGIAVQASRITYAQGQLVLWSRSRDLALSKEYLLDTNNYDRISMANPRLAPYGKAALETLQNLGLDALMDERVVTGENIAQAFQFVFSGNADLGLIAYSQAVDENLSSPGSFWIVPSELYQPIKQDMVTIRDSTAAREFLAFMQGPQARDILVQSGYLLADGDS